MRARRSSDDIFNIYEGSFGESPLRTSARGSRRRGRCRSLAEAPAAVKFANAQRQRHLAARRQRKAKALSDRKTSAMVRNIALQKIEKRKTRPVSWALGEADSYEARQHFAGLLFRI